VSCVILSLSEAKTVPGYGRSHSGWGTKDGKNKAFIIGKDVAVDIN